jgi:hypothetical protein
MLNLSKSSASSKPYLKFPNDLVFQALFFCSFLKQHGALIEKKMNHEMLKSLYYLLIISEVEEVEIFKVCLEYWSSLAAELYHETPFSGQMGLGSGSFRYG